MVEATAAVYVEKSNLTRGLLWSGVISGPLFIVTVLVQALTVPGFDLRVDLISLLSLAPRTGFIQIANFALCGLLNLMFAVGAWRVLHPGPGGIFGPIFTALHGLLLIVVAVFVTDPANGFPPGVPTPSTPSLHGIVHAGTALWVFVTCAAALAVFARHFLARHQSGWAFYCGSSAVLMLAIFFSSFGLKINTAPVLDVSLVIGWMGISLVAVALLRESDVTHA